MDSPKSTNLSSSDHSQILNHGIDRLISGLSIRIHSDSQKKSEEKPEASPAENIAQPQAEILHMPTGECVPSEVAESTESMERSNSGLFQEIRKQGFVAGLEAMENNREDSVSSGSTISAAGDEDDSAPRTLRVTFSCSLQADVPSHAAYVPYYLGTRLMGPAAEFDRRIAAYTSEALQEDDDVDDLKCISLRRLIDLGIVVGNLGTLSPIPIPKGLRELPTAPILSEFMIFGGLGEPGTLTRDDIRFLMTNVVYAVKALRPSVDALASSERPFELCTPLIGTYSRSLNAKQSVRSTIEGIVEGMGRFGVNDLTLIFAVEDLQTLGIQIYSKGWKGKILKFFEERTSELGQVFAKQCKIQFKMPGEINAKLNSFPPRQPTEKEDESVDDGQDDGQDKGKDLDCAQLTITSDQSTEQRLREEKRHPQKVANEPSSLSWIDFNYSAMTSNSAVPVRTVSIQKHFHDFIPRALLSECEYQGQWEYGNLMMHFFIPDDFQQLIDDKDGLTIVVDQFTASIPWEMAGFSSRTEKGQKFYGTDREMSRQFRSVLGSTNAHAPEIDNTLNVLIIADPVGHQDYALPEAAKEGIAIADLFARTALKYGDRVKFEIDLRIGNENRKYAPDSSDDSDMSLAELREKYAREKYENVAMTIDECNPIEILRLLVHKRYDIVHFAGHGRYEPQTHDIGWMLDVDCTLTAKEIFRVRHVPRLVFANACRSGVVRHDGDEEEGEKGITEKAGTPDKGVVPAVLPKAGVDAILKELYGIRNDDRAKLEIMRYQVSMAEAFFSRGIPNFIGTGWNVDDAKAKEMALAFYGRILGWNNYDPQNPNCIENQTPSDPKRIGEALREARKLIVPKHGDRSHEKSRDMGEGSNGEHSHNHDSNSESHSEHISWGAYQHYGLPTDFLFRPKSDSAARRSK